MNTFRNFVRQLSATWNQAGAAQRAALSAAGILLLVAVVGVGIWSARPQYVDLQTGLSPTERSKLIAALEAGGIEYKLSLSGSTVKVSQKNLNAAMLAAGDLVDPSTSPLPGISSSVFDGPGHLEYELHKNLERSLEKTIIGYQGVANANVHIGKPAASPFVSQQRDTTASVVLAMDRNATFSARQVAAIVATVSKAVDGLRPENVSVSDTHGRLLSTENHATADIAGQLEYKQRVETDLSANAELMLSQLLGFGKAFVKVTADIDFTRSTRTETLYDPNAKVRTSETIITKETKSAPRTQAGPPGVASNLGPAVSGIGGGAEQTSTSDETIESQYEVGKTEDQVTEAAGKIKRLTIAAVVDLSSLEQSGEGAATEVSKDNIEAIIKQAVGFDNMRNDEIEVLVSKLAAAPVAAEPVAPSPWQGYETIVKHASLGVAALVALVMTVLILRKVQPGNPMSNGGLAPKHARALASMSEAMRADPHQLKEALSLWLEAEDEEAEPARAA